LENLVSTRADLGQDPREGGFGEVIAPKSEVEFRFPEADLSFRKPGED
jgi:hypothetical protein